MVLGSSPREPTINTSDRMKTIDAEKVFAAQMRAMQTLETNIKLLEDATRQLKSKVTLDKLEGAYSQNSDCLTYAVKVWSACLRLAELKKLQWELDDRDSNGKKLNKEKK